MSGMEIFDVALLWPLKAVTAIGERSSVGRLLTVGSLAAGGFAAVYMFGDPRVLLATQDYTKLAMAYILCGGTYAVASQLTTLS